MIAGSERLLERAASAAATAASFAEEVDTAARFPVETIRSLKEQQLLGLLVPVEFGGPGVSLGEVLMVCRVLGQACGSSALIYAMHQIQVACAVSGAGDGDWQHAFLARIARDQMLLGSVTSEVGIGGDIRSSICAPSYVADRLSMTKRSSAISYGQHADALLVTARRHDGASSSDQIAIVVERADYALEPTASWDTLGMRGTDSKAFNVTLDASEGQILPRSFSHIAQQTMLPTSHILWGGVWLGIATDAAEKARAFLRRQAQTNPGASSPGALRLERIASLLVTIRARLDIAVHDYAAVPAGDADEYPLGLMTELNALKVTVSELALSIVQEAMMVCGIHGYKNGTPYSVGRHLRDLQSAPIMVNNDRIRANTATLLVAQRSSMMKA